MRIGTNPLLITWNMVSYPKIPTTRLRYDKRRLILYTTRAHYTGDLLTIYSYYVLARKKVTKPWNKLIRECVEPIRLAPNCITG